MPHCTSAPGTAAPNAAGAGGEVLVAAPQPHASSVIPGQGPRSAKVWSWQVSAQIPEVSWRSRGRAGLTLTCRRGWAMLCCSRAPWPPPGSVPRAAGPGEGHHPRPRVPLPTTRRGEVAPRWSAQRRGLACPSHAGRLRRAGPQPTPPLGLGPPCPTQNGQEHWERQIKPQFIPAGDLTLGVPGPPTPPASPPAKGQPCCPAAARIPRCLELPSLWKCFYKEQEQYFSRFFLNISLLPDG